MKKRIKQTALILILVLGLAVFVLPSGRALAACGAGQTPLTTNERVCCPTGTHNNATDCMYAKYINPVVMTLSILAGIAVVAGIVMGGIQYASSAGDPQRAAKGQSTITKSLVGLVSFMFLYSALQFFSPGGIARQPMPDAAKGGTIANQCSSTFLGLKPWFAYLPNEAFGKDASDIDEDGNISEYTCNVDNFSLIGEQGSTGATTKSSDLGYVVLAVVDALVRIAGLVAVAFVIVGGIQFVTSQGEPEKTKRARETIINALAGVAVAIVAAAVVSFIGNQLSS